METLVLSATALTALVLPNMLVWRLGRRARVPRWIRAMFLVAGWMTVILGLTLALRAQPFLFPETSPCGREMMPVSRYFPPDSFCLHADGELRTVNGPDARFFFWAAVGTTVAMVVAAAVVVGRRRLLAPELSGDPASPAGPLRRARRRWRAGR
ncbi:hypothetical protein [Streptomyces sp. NPDC046887]|uniref:hypothetical protein n=1 Tax=Streptomyces sp. NPDC046887 TaxID=3155472 RepID=UPI0033DE2025